MEIEDNVRRYKVQDVQQEPGLVAIWSVNSQVELRNDVVKAGVTIDGNEPIDQPIVIPRHMLQEVANHLSAFGWEKFDG